MGTWTVGFRGLVVRGQGSEQEIELGLVAVAVLTLEGVQERSS